MVKDDVMATAITYPPIQHIIYPESDGLPIAESDFQRIPLTYAVEALSLYFEHRPDVYVSGNLFVYYEEGNPKAVVAPDVFVVVGADKRERRSYFLWREPKGPDFVLEITSKSTRGEDQGPKRGTYALLGVREYVQNDPTQDYLTPPLKGLRLVGDNYEPLPTVELPDGTLIVHSEVLGLDMRLANGEFHFVDPTTGLTLLTYREAYVARLAAEQARQTAEQGRQAAAARVAAEARVAELEARLRALQGEP